MPDDKEKKVVDIDTSGPGEEVTLPEEKGEGEDKTYENERETKLEDGGIAGNSAEKSDQQLDVRTEEDDAKQKTSKDGSDQQQDNSKAVEDYSEGVKKRIAKLTKKMREAERQKEEALAFAQRVQKERDQFEAKSNLLRARENGDINAEVEAQKEIARIGVEESKVTTLKNRYKQQATQTPVAPKTLDQAVQTPPSDPKAEAWADKNEWFGKDNAMTYTAFDLHRKLTEEEGMDPQSDEYYSEVDKRIRLEFPHKFDKVEQQTSKPTQNVASATRSSKTGRKTVRLTPSQVAIAKKLGVPLEEYAKQLINTKEV